MFDDRVPLEIVFKASNRFRQVRTRKKMQKPTYKTILIMFVWIQNTHSQTTCMESEIHKKYTREIVS